MQLREIFEYIEKIGFLVFSTIEDGCVHSRVAHFYAWDERGCICGRCSLNPFTGR